MTDLDKIIEEIVWFGNLSDNFTVYDFVTGLQKSELESLERVMKTEIGELLYQLTLETNAEIDPAILALQLHNCIRFVKGAIQINTERGSDNFRVIPFSCN